MREKDAWSIKPRIFNDRPCAVLYHHGRIAARAIIYTGDVVIQRKVLSVPVYYVLKTIQRAVEKALEDYE